MSERGSAFSGAVSEYGTKSPAGRRMPDGRKSRILPSSVATAMQRAEIRGDVELVVLDGGTGVDGQRGHARPRVDVDERLVAERLRSAAVDPPCHQARLHRLVRLVVDRGP